MKPIETIDRDTTPDGVPVLLQHRDGTYNIVVGGVELMSSFVHGSEEELARLACADLAPAGGPPRILIGGLGMGFTLRAALDALPARARIVIAEALPPVVRWNKGPLAPLAGNPLHDRRVRLREADVGVVLAEIPPLYDAIILDVDNGPDGLTLRSNAGLYTDRGIALALRALAPRGTLAVWSAAPDASYERRLRRAGLDVKSKTVAARSSGKGPRHTLFLARRAEGRRRDPLPGHGRDPARRRS